MDATKATKHGFTINEVNLGIRREPETRLTAIRAVHADILAFQEAETLEVPLPCGAVPERYAWAMLVDGNEPATSRS